MRNWEHPGSIIISVLIFFLYCTATEWSANVLTWDNIQMKRRLEFWETYTVFQCVLHCNTSTYHYGLRICDTVYFSGYVGPTNVSDKPGASVFVIDEGGGKRFFPNVAVCLQIYIYSAWLLQVALYKINCLLLLIKAYCLLCELRIECFYKM
jgi:hypothetical protein